LYGLIRDGLIVKAYGGGIAQKEISALVGDVGQLNVARALRRVITRRDTFWGQCSPLMTPGVCTWP
jgi:hypothetical protein